MAGLEIRESVTVVGRAERARVARAFAVRKERCATPLPFYDLAIRGARTPCRGGGPVAGSGRLRVGVGSAAIAVSPSVPGSHRLPFSDFARRVQVPDWSSAGLRPAQEDRWAPDGNRVLSSLVSAMASWAARRAQPAWTRLAAVAPNTGPAGFSISSEIRLISPITRSMRSIIMQTSVVPLPAAVQLRPAGRGHPLLPSRRRSCPGCRRRGPHGGYGRSAPGLGARGCSTTRRRQRRHGLRRAGPAASAAAP